MSEQLPVCALCGHEPGFRSPPVTVECATAGCPIRAVRMTVEDWRRLMARPRLAPEHVEALRFLLCYYAEYEKRHGLVVGSDTHAIRAALAALGEE